jgi:hypothetical protein
VIRWLKSLFAWESVRWAGCYLYEENRITGRRRATTITSGGYSPIDFDWLDGGKGHPIIDGMPAWRTAQGQGRTGYFL